MVELYPINSIDISTVHNFGSKVLPGIFFSYVLYAERIWTSYIKVVTNKKLHASELHARLNAEEALPLMQGDNFLCWKSPNEIDVWDHSPYWGIVQNEERNK